MSIMELGSRTKDSISGSLEISWQKNHLNLGLFATSSD